MKNPTTGFDWTGSISARRAVTARATPIGYAPNGSLAPSGGFGGGQAGANVQLGVVVLGVEGEVIGGGSRFLRDGTTLDFQTRTDWLGMATARVGMVTNERWLTYIKGGVAAADERNSASLSAVGGFADFRGSRIHTGYVAGAGVEYAFAPNWSVQAEYNYINFGIDNATIEGAVNVPPLVGNYFTAALIGQTMQRGKIGINYHFAP